MRSAGLSLVIVDTNVLVSGLRYAESPPGRVLNATFAGSLEPIVSRQLLDEYGRVLQRPRVVRFLQMDSQQVRGIVGFFEAIGLFVESYPAPLAAPDPLDQHLWDLLAAVPGSTLVTGDRLLLDSGHYPDRILSPRSLLESRGS